MSLIDHLLATVQNNVTASPACPVDLIESPASSPVPEIEYCIVSPDCTSTVTVDFVPTIKVYTIPGAAVGNVCLLPIPEAVGPAAPPVSVITLPLSAAITVFAVLADV